MGFTKQKDNSKVLKEDIFFLNCMLNITSGILFLGAQYKYTWTIAFPGESTCDALYKSVGCCLGLLGVFCLDVCCYVKKKGNEDTSGMKWRRLVERFTSPVELADRVSIPPLICITTAFCRLEGCADYHFDSSQSSQFTWYNFAFVQLMRRFKLRFCNPLKCCLI